MDNDIADALIQFYQQILKPEFDAIKAKQAEHDERFDVVTGHLDAIYHRLGTLED